MNERASGPVLKSRFGVILNHCEFKGKYEGLRPTEIWVKSAALTFEEKKRSQGTKKNWIEVKTHSRKGIRDTFFFWGGEEGRGLEGRGAWFSGREKKEKGKERRMGRRGGIG